MSNARQFSIRRRPRAIWGQTAVPVAPFTSRAEFQAYARACSKFFAWCEDHGLTLTTIRPFDVATYIETLQKTHSAPGVKQQLAAVRMLFDWLITGQVVPVNPASAVRGPKLVRDESAGPGARRNRTTSTSGAGMASALSGARAS